MTHIFIIFWLFCGVVKLIRYVDELDLKVNNEVLVCHQRMRKIKATFRALLSQIWKVLKERSN